MTTIPSPPTEKTVGVPPLVNGDRMKQPEFHRRYERCPKTEKWELVGGIVYMTSPLRYPHGIHTQNLGLILGLYVSETPGVEAADNTTAILGEESEPQPDLLLRIIGECGGQSRVDEKEYLVGPPELVVEVAFSSRALDLNQKKQDYQLAGVCEYLVLSLEDQQLFWFQFPSGEEIQPNRQGVSRSVVFPGLWVDGAALVARDVPRLVETARCGLASRPHATFVRRLEARRRKSR